MTDTQPFDDERVSAYLDGELTDSERTEFELLLDQRPDYVQVLEQLRTIRSAIKALPQHKLPADFADGILSRAEREMLIGTQTPVAPRSRSTRLSLDKSLWAVVAVASCFLAMLVWSRLEPSHETQVAQTDKPATADASREDRERLGRRAPLAGTDVAPAERDFPEKLSASHDNRVTAAAEGTLADAEAAAQAGQAGRAATAVVAEAAPASAKFGVQPTTTGRQLTEQAEVWIQKSAAFDEQWDVIVATQLQAPRDWQQLKRAFVANRLQFTKEPSNSVQTLALADEPNGNFDATLFNEQFLRRLDSSALALNEEETKLAPTRGPGTTTSRDTYLLYVEGTPSQLAGLVRQLPGASTAELVNIKPPSGTATRRRAGLTLAKNRMADERSNAAADSESPHPSTTGLAVNLGQSTLDEALSPAACARAKKISLACQQTYRPQLKDLDDGHDPEIQRGLIILQDVSATSNSNAANFAPDGSPTENDAEPLDAEDGS